LNAAEGQSLSLGFAEQDAGAGGLLLVLFAGPLLVRQGKELPGTLGEATPVEPHGGGLLQAVQISASGIHLDDDLDFPSRTFVQNSLDLPINGRKLRHRLYLQNAASKILR
jgi:hypothetical protein